VTSTVKESLIAALHRLLRPLVRLLIKQGISISDFAEVIKQVYVETAVRDFSIESKPMSRSRIAVLTGLTRKEVRRIIALTLESEPEPPTKANLLIRVLQAWHTDATFLGPYGLPRDLPWQSKKATVPDFTLLVRKHSREINPKEVLREFLRTEAVTELEPGVYKVIRRDYEAQALDAANLERFGIVIRNFLQTVIDNLEKPRQQGGNFERIVFTDDPVHRERVKLFDQWIKQEGQIFLERIDDWFINNLAESSDGPSSEDHPDAVFTGLGMYHFITDTQDEISFRELLHSQFGPTATSIFSPEETLVSEEAEFDGED